MKKVKVRLTFGLSHEVYHNKYKTLGCILPYHNGYVELLADSYQDARALAVKVFGLEWCTTYSELDGELPITTRKLATIEAQIKITFHANESDSLSYTSKVITDEGIKDLPNVFDPTT